MQILLNEVQITVGTDTGSGAKILTFTTPQGIVVVVPLSPMAAKQVAMNLGSGVLVATDPLPPNVPPSHGGLAN